MGECVSFDEYIEHLFKALGYSDRHVGMKDYYRGLMLPLERKSVEPLAAVLDPLHVSSKHQSLPHFVSTSSWSDAAVLARVREWVQPMLGLVRGHLSSRQKKGGKVAWRLHRKTFSSDERDPSCRWDVRQCAAWLGLVPHQHSTGSKTRLLGITKRGNSYVRRLLVHGARAMLAAAERFHKTDALSCWARAVSQRRGKNRAVVAVAN